uniref:Uncharacterized protein n=1 Tax=Solanum lycopersicum TaxID=4081 RepID=A0A3Q7EUP9_SOLLC
MENMIGVIMPYIQPWVIVPYEEKKSEIGVIVPYMQPGVIVPCEDIKKKR